MHVYLRYIRWWWLLIFHKRLTILFYYYRYHFKFFTTPNRRPNFTEYTTIFFISLCFWTRNFEICSILGVDLYIYIRFKWKIKKNDLFLPYYNFIYYSVMHVVVIFVHNMPSNDHILCCGHINNLGYGTKILRTRRWYCVYINNNLYFAILIGVD